MVEITKLPCPLYLIANMPGKFFLMSNLSTFH